MRLSIGALGIVCLGCKPVLVGSPTEVEEADVVFHRDVAPVLAAHCGRCHDGSGVGPGNLLDYADAFALGEVMLSEIEAGRMPPPAADPDCHPYQGGDWMVLPDAARDVIARWVELGKPEGEEVQGALPVGGPIPLSRTDVELVAQAPYVPDFVDSNEYRCFLLGEAEADAFIAGFDFLVDQRSVSHHALFFKDPNGGSEALIEDPATGSWRCPEVLPQPEWELIHAWAPSGGALEFPYGMGLPVTAGTQFVVQMHYFDGGAPVADQPGYALKLEDAVDRELLYLPVGPTEFQIPAGDPSFSATELVEMSLVTLFGVLEFDVWGVLPHMHVLGSGYDFHGVSATGDQKCISRAAAYDFDMQPTYWFDEPVELTSTDTLSVTCTWDNSADNPDQPSQPPVDVFWGENTQEEMCFALLYAHPRLAD
ncbi:MAG: hypothetical protein KTR31_00250 [Myxococcales bacterium]|nr:hypothetical protein [Myxococcales bacterium]